MTFRPACCLLLLLLLSASALAQPAEEDPLQVPKQEPARLMPYYTKDSRGGIDLNKQIEKAPKTEAKVRKAVMQLLAQERGDVDRAASRTLGIVNWHRWPRNPDIYRQAEFEKKDRMNLNLGVNYRKWSDGQGKNILFLQNSYWESNGNRISPIIYALILDGERMTTAPLTPYPVVGLDTTDEKHTVDWMGMNPPIFLLGFAPGKNNMPDVLVVDGPAGQVQVSYFYLYSYDEQKKAWMPKLIDEQHHVSFYYDEEKAELRYTPETVGIIYEDPKPKLKHYLYKVGSEGPIEVDEQGNPVPTPTPQPYATPTPTPEGAQPTPQPTPEIPQEQPAQ